MPPKNFGGIANSRKYAPEKNWDAIRVLAVPQNIYFLPNFVSSAMPPKDLAPFSCIDLTKTLLMIKYNYRLLVATSKMGSVIAG